MLTAAIRYAAGSGVIRDHETIGLLTEARFEDCGSSAGVLDLLCFELLLKACVLLEAGCFGRSHSYVELWRALDDDARLRIQDLAVHREGGRGYYFTNDNLEGLARAFSKVRYGYEESLKYTPYQNTRRGEEWVARGSPVDKADFNTFASELTAMNFALARHLSQRLGVDTPNLYRLF
jgi:hypothetical protein